MKKHLLFITFLASMCISSCANNSYLKRDDWEDGVKENLNKLIRQYKNKNEYVVFDFDNTTAIFDIEEQLLIYTLETMSFEMTPEEMPNVLKSGISDLNEDLSSYGYFDHGSFSDVIDDISSSYKILYEKYGEFTYKGLSITEQEKIHNDDYWKEFATKYRMMYDLICDAESTLVSYPWIIYAFTGLTNDEVYDLAYRSHTYYANYKSCSETWYSPDITSKVGKTQISFTRGVTVTENLKELWKEFNDNGIDVWVCSASGIDVVKAAVDAFGLHDYCKGAIAYNIKLDKDNKYISEYDYETGYGYFAKENSSWEKMPYAVNVQTQTKGKVVGINNAIYPLYNKGPIAGFMDSSGDFNFCTEYNSLKLVVCFNRANRKVTDGGGLIALVAMHQKENLKYDLNKANKNNDTLYLLQGRDENDLRSLRNSNSTLRLGSTEEKLFANDDNYAMFNYFKKENLSTEEIINKYCIKTSTADSQFGFKYGFFDSYDGYHSVK